MSSKFMPVLTKLGVTAKRFSSEIPKAISNPALNIEQAQRLCDATATLCNQAAELADTFQSDGADEPFVKAAEALQGIFVTLHEAIGARLTELGGVRGPLTRE